MMDAHTLTVAGFVSQMTFFFTFALLAWSDRRTKGMSWLAAAQILWTITRALPTPSPAAKDVSGSVAFILTIFCYYMGLRWFAVRRDLRSRKGPVGLAIALVAVMAMAPFNVILAMVTGRLVVLFIIGLTVRMVWSSRLTALRIRLRVTAVLLSVTGALIAVQSAMMLLPPTHEVLQQMAFVRACVQLYYPLVLLSFVALYVAEANRRLHDETRMDVLTGLRNRRALEEIATRKAYHCATHGIPLSLLMMDLDHFKQLNDTWGHGLGDRALRAMGSILLTVISEDAVTARVGGEEFAVLLAGYTCQAAAAVAERVRSVVEDLQLAEGDRMARFTVSVGVSELQPGERTWTDMMARADEALYRAKREGRNRVAIAEPLDLADMPRPREQKSSSWKLLLRQGPML